MAATKERFFLELEPPSEELRDKPHVVIVGGGFAGVKACKAFKGADVRVTLIDKRNFNLFQPLLHPYRRLMFHRQYPLEMVRRCPLVPRVGGCAGNTDR